MSFIGNLIWFLLGGFILGLGWIIAGILWCITIIGIPLGIQCFKIAGVAMFPFGRKVVNNGSAMSLLLNILWICISGVELAVCHLVIGLLFCITIIGIPFGRQHFKLAQVALMPIGCGKQVVWSGGLTSPWSFRPCTPWAASPPSADRRTCAA